jgi:TolB-like protein/class 3 adenylate cyclase/cytochrome c-type biogenesis protein CcmH/NrfG
VEQQRIERRLAAILAADVAGYSRLIGADEEGTVVRLRALRRELIDPAIAEHRGRIVKTTGDDLLVEFASVVDAVRCAVEVQRSMALRNNGIATDRRIEFRVGINLGDVVVEGDDLLGDGVNVAARLEGLAEPGGVCISEDAHRHLRGKVDTTFIDLGKQQLKNIAEPVRLYAVALPIGRRKATPASASSTKLAPRLSIVVLPLANPSGDAEQDYFVDGLTEDLASELSRLPSLFVIARNSAFFYKGKSPDVQQVGRELGVRYVLEGSVRKAGQRARVAAQLIDAETRAHLWVNRFDRTISNLFELQDAITLELARVLDITLVEAESRRGERLASPDALDLVMRARAFANRGLSLENYADAARLYEQALQLAPDDVQALTGLACVLAANIGDLSSATREEDLRRAEALAGRGLVLEPHDARCHFAMGVVRRLQGRFDEAINDFDTAIRLNPSMHGAQAELGLAKAFLGQGEDALPHFAEMIRLSPRDPLLFVGYFGIGRVRFQCGDDDGAIETLRKALALSPNHSSSHLWVTAAYGMRGRIEEARAALAAYFRTGTPSNTIALVRARVISTHPAVVGQRERLYEGLRKAGMPEE